MAPASGDREAVPKEVLDAFLRCRDVCWPLGEGGYWLASISWRFKLASLTSAALSSKLNQ